MFWWSVRLTCGTIWWNGKQSETQIFFFKLEIFFNFIKMVVVFFYFKFKKTRWHFKKAQFFFYRLNLLFFSRMNNLKKIQMTALFQFSINFNFSIHFFLWISKESICIALHTKRTLFIEIWARVSRKRLYSCLYYKLSTKAWNNEWPVIKSFFMHFVKE